MASQRISDGKGGLLQVSSSPISQHPTTWRVYVGPDTEPIIPKQTWCVDVRTLHEGDAVDEALRAYHDAHYVDEIELRADDEVRRAEAALGYF